MLPVTETVFWISLLILFYTYVGYPIVLVLLVCIKELLTGRKSQNVINEEPVTLIVAAYNEENLIEQKIQNCLSLDYEPGNLKFLFVTDGSTDRTPELVEKYPVITLLHSAERKGKLAAMNRAMQHVTTSVVIFNDANTTLNKDCVKLIMRHYSDENVGAVAGEKKIIAEDGVARGEGLYWRYESFLKKFDSRLCTVVGAAGELFSIRTSLYETLPEHIIIEDFVQSLKICEKGYVVRYEPNAFSMENASVTESDEMERKVRIAAGGFQAIGYLKSLLNFFRFPVISFQYLSHRLLRWTLCPPSIALLLISSVILSGQGAFFQGILLLQLLFHLMGMVGWLLARNGKRPGPFYFPYYFIFMNLSVVLGFFRYISGKQQTNWKKAVRKVKNNE